ASVDPRFRSASLVSLRESGCADGIAAVPSVRNRIQILSVNTWLYQQGDIFRQCFLGQ
ncbi:hypothetical protein DPEC_G00223680, partial [Dallia pectoralis]